MIITPFQCFFLRCFDVQSNVLVFYWLKTKEEEWDSQLHDQVEVVWALVDVLQRHNVLVLDPENK